MIAVASTDRPRRSKSYRLMPAGRAGTQSIDIDEDNEVRPTTQKNILATTPPRSYPVSSPNFRSGNKSIEPHMLHAPELDGVAGLGISLRKPSVLHSIPGKERRSSSTAAEESLSKSFDLTSPAVVEMIRTDGHLSSRRASISTATLSTVLAASLSLTDKANALGMNTTSSHAGRMGKRGPAESETIVNIQDQDQRVDQQLNPLLESASSALAASLAKSPIPLSFAKPSAGHPFGSIVHTKKDVSGTSPKSSHKNIQFAEDLVREARDGTSAMSIPHDSERRSYSRRNSGASASQVSPSASHGSLACHRSDTNMSRSLEPARGPWRKSRHARSLSFGDSEEEEDDSEWREFRNSPPSLPLVPYRNQVGGHASFLRFSDKALCKPLNSREKEFYEVVETMHPEIKRFMATYLGIVNVTYSTAREDADAFGVAEGTPLVILEENKHMLSSDFGIESDEVNNDDPLSNCLNRKLQQQVFRDALSPQSLRARFAQLRTALGAMQRRYSFSSSDPTSPTLHPMSDPLAEAGAELGPSTPSPTAKLGKSRDKRPSKADPTGSAEAASSVFHMSDDEEDAGGSSRSPVSTPKRLQDLKLPTRLIRSPSTPVAASVSSNHFQSDTDPRTPVKGAALGKTASSPTVAYNPWSLHLYNNTISKLAESEKGKRRTDQFLLLEDLTQGFQYPCILDLKMGSRQHGVYATNEKRISQERKCEKSTSKKMGVRICGMQVYKPPTGTFTYLDKYVGRQINGANFKQSLLTFLDAGEKYLIGYIPQLLQKLRNLHEAVSKMTTFRFYASSLLILYDGAWADDDGTGAKLSISVVGENGEPVAPPPREMDMKMIDFANCVSNVTSLRGLNEVDSVSSDDTNSENDSDAKQNAKIPVPFPPTTVGPDNGYLLGLRTLIKSFDELFRELGGNNSQLLDCHGHVWKKNLTHAQRLYAEPTNVMGNNNIPGGGAAEAITSGEPLMFGGSSSSAASAAGFSGPPSTPATATPSSSLPSSLPWQRSQAGGTSGPPTSAAENERRRRASAFVVVRRNSEKVPVSGAKDAKQPPRVNEPLSSLSSMIKSPPTSSPSSPDQATPPAHAKQQAGVRTLSSTAMQEEQQGPEDFVSPYTGVPPSVDRRMP
ncbi:uncharacterized protein EV422DRAFT_413440 [Fimicolochytrium jonesii]|uniref:uncharacterized protein n=1 Tax=Fimicolochytrium jonesii TaxID=1396493 RepID=UPI0022FECFE2|nr:uncharacterized protein EV422DRAFT_413440 [Fimicolochytrium jonesii]KAI8822017.1 hypothetical protein EV422DRAFT_413440 [Fimicolochytrium jonesii]